MLCASLGVLRIDDDDDDGGGEYFGHITLLFQMLYKQYYCTSSWIIEHTMFRSHTEGRRTS